MDEVSFFNEVIVESFAESLGLVMVWVFLGLVLFSLINYFFANKLEEKIQKSTKIQPILGALSGLIPGCGGAAITSSLYVKNKVTFGTLFASLIATTGDAAFVLLAVEPLIWLYLALFAFAFGIIFGYIADWIKIGKKVDTREQNIFEAKKLKREEKQKKLKIIEKYESKSAFIIDYYVVPIFLSITLFFAFFYTINTFGANIPFVDQSWYGILLVIFGLLLLDYYFGRKLY